MKRRQRKSRRIEIEIGPRIEGQDRPPPRRWKPALIVLGMLLLAGAGAGFWLTRRAPFAAPPAPSGPVAGEPAPETPPPAPEAEPVPELDPALAELSSETPITEVPPPSPGALRIVVRAPEHAAAYLGRTARRVRLDTNAWQTVTGLPHLLAGLPAGPVEVGLEATGFQVEPTSAVALVESERTNEVVFTLSPEPARLTVHCATAGAEVFDAEGKRLGAAGEALTLASLQPLTLAVRAPGHVAGVLRLRPLEPGKAYRQEVKLEPDPAPAAAAGPEAGKARTVDLGGGVRMEFVWIEALKLWVGKYEVTNEQYRRKEPGHDSTAYGGHRLNGDRQPVVYVNFDDAKAYAQWLTEQERRSGSLPAGYRYRLPSEAEWMTFAQCGDGRKYPWGNNWPPRSGQAGNYHGQEGAGSWTKIGGYNDGHPVTCDVEKSWANPWGLYGVGGNVWECCAKDSSGGAFGAWRGASWYGLSQDYLRCSARLDYIPSYRDDYFGFRLVLSRP